MGRAAAVIDGISREDSVHNIEYTSLNPAHRVESSQNASNVITVKLNILSFHFKYWIVITINIVRDLNILILNVMHGITPSPPPPQSLLLLLLYLFMFIRRTDFFRELFENFEWLTSTSWLTHFVRFRRNRYRNFRINSLQFTSSLPKCVSRLKLKYDHWKFWSRFIYFIRFR